MFFRLVLSGNEGTFEEELGGDGGAFRVNKIAGMVIPEMMSAITN